MCSPGEKIKVAFKFFYEHKRGKKSFPVSIGRFYSSAVTISADFFAWEPWEGSCPEPADEKQGTPGDYGSPWAGPMQEASNGPAVQ